MNKEGTVTISISYFDELRNKFRISDLNTKGVIKFLIDRQMETINKGTSAYPERLESELRTLEHFYQKITQ